jgi:hypothetical protein
VVGKNSKNLERADEAAVQSEGKPEDRGGQRFVSRGKAPRASEEGMKGKEQPGQVRMLLQRSKLELVGLGNAKLKMLFHVVTFSSFSVKLFSIMCSAGGQTQGLTHARRALSTEPPKSFSLTPNACLFYLTMTLPYSPVTVLPLLEASLEEDGPLTVSASSSPLALQGSALSTPFKLCQATSGLHVPRSSGL